MPAVNALVPSRGTLASPTWWSHSGAVALIALCATVVSYGIALSDLQISLLLLLPGVGSALLARLGRSLWPALIVGDLVGQVIATDRTLQLTTVSVAIHALACLLGATLLQRSDCWLRDMRQALRFIGIVTVISVGGGVLTASFLTIGGEMPGQLGAAEVIGWMITGYLAGFLVGGGFVLAWGDPLTPIRDSFRQRIAMCAFVAVTATAAVGLLAEIGPLVPLALAGTVAIAGRSGMRWGIASILAIALMAVEGVEGGVEPAFGGQNAAEAVANGMLAMSLFAAAVIGLAAYRTSNEERARSPM